MLKVLRVTSRNKVNLIEEKGPVKGLFFGDLIKNENI